MGPKEKEARNEDNQTKENGLRNTVARGQGWGVNVIFTFLGRTNFKLYKKVTRK